MGRTSGPSPTTIDRDLLRWSGVKLCLLLADGVGLGWGLVRLFGDGRAALVAFGAMVLVALVGVGGCLVVVLVGHLEAALHLIPPPAHLGALRQVWSGAVGGSLLVLGSAVGRALATGQHGAAGLLLVYGSQLATVVLALLMTLQVPFALGGSGGFDLKLVWAALFLLLMVAGGALEVSGGAATIFLFLTLGSPLWHGLFLLATRNRVDRWFEVGGETGLDRRAVVGRRALLFRVTVAFPLGGLAVPWWLHLRQGQIGAPEDER